MMVTTSIQSHSTTKSFDLEDAFDDGDDDHDEGFQFSSHVIRQEMAKNLSSWSNGENVEDEQESSFENHQSFRELDMSVSTLDINGETHSSPPPDTPDDEGNPTQFVQISLSNSGSDFVQGQEDPSEPEPATKRSPVDDTVVAGEQSPHPYPAVHIDASQPPAHRVSISSSHNEVEAEEKRESPTTTPPSSPPRSSSAGSENSSGSGLKASQSLPPSPYHPEHNLNQAASTSALPSPSVAAAAAAVLAAEQPVNSPSTPTSPSLPPPTTKPTHRQTRSVGPSTFEKVRSRTRPSFLPPKSRQEDDKHMAEWHALMKQSRTIAEQKRKALQDRRMAREKKIDDSLHYWEKEIVPDWRVVLVNPEMRKVWWRGIPTKLRAFMWEKAVGNPLALSKDNYRSCIARAKKALNAGTFPAATLTMIDEDIASTLPALHIFHHETGPLYADLKDMLCAWVVARSDEGLGYVFGASKIAAMFLLNMPIQQGFVVMRNLLERHCMRSFYGGDHSKDEVEAYYRIFDTLLADGMPKIYFNFKQHQISPAAYLPDWLVPLFLNHLPFEACARIWDVVMLEGDAFLYRAALGILAVLEPRLFFPDRKELIELLRGENSAAIEVARREGQALNGGKYEIYGVDEETLWDRIDGMEGWWKESTWNRLIQRELPDR
ncbi:hypothetical protein V5O48_009037 [Marasmius crinis-equi]|uniref:Rab-GAP TBC domain-containing protein n=1 Tax=Marasmius crinis-equi TaxID=585013 RepID=A0ABR3FCB0_9AGAR